MLEVLKCQSCGGTINSSSLKCEYCGTQYERKIERGITHYIQTCPATIQTLATQVEVDDELLMNASRDIVAEYAMKDIVNSLAQALVPFVKIETTPNVCKCTQIIRGTIRVVEPDFRF